MQAVKRFDAIQTCACHLPEDNLKVHKRKRFFNAFAFASGYIYVTVTFFKSHVSSFFNIFRFAKKFINFIINP